MSEGFEDYRKALRKLKLPPRDPDDPERREAERAWPIIKLMIEKRHEEKDEIPKCFAKMDMEETGNCGECKHAEQCWDLSFPQTDRKR